MSDTASNTVIANIPIGQAPQAIAYVPNAAPDPEDRQNLQALGVAGEDVHLPLAPKDGSKDGQAPTSDVALPPEGCGVRKTKDRILARCGRPESDDCVEKPLNWPLVEKWLCRSVWPD